MIKSSLVALTLAVSGFSFGQTVSDDLTWVTTTTTTTQQSPDFQDCDDGIVNYRITAVTEDFQRHASGSGALFPAVTGTNSATSVSIDITFNTTVNNLRIKLVDLDRDASPIHGNPEESITSISPAADERILQGVGPLGPGNSVIPTVNNQDCWIEFNSASNVTFDFIRPGRGYGLIIDSIQWDCPESECPCPADIGLQAGNITNAGVGNANLVVSSSGEAISSLIIEMPAYQVVTDPECRECNTANPESYGSFLNVPTILGVTGVPYEPFGAIGGVRKIRYDFATPTVINQNIALQLQFPPVLDLSCCKNVVNYCLNVTLIKDDCTSCEYDVCAQNGTPPGVKKRTAAFQKAPTRLNDGPMHAMMTENDFQLSVNPNPTSSKINATIDMEDFESAEVFLYSVEGTLISQSQTKDTRFSMEITTPGNYILTVTSNGKRASQKVMVL